MNRKPWIAIGLLVLVSVGLVLVWKAQGLAMRRDFTRALSAGDIQSPHRDLWGKTWTEEELASAEVLKISSSHLPEQALERSVHEWGRVELNAQRYEYQGTVRDASTNLVHVFGRTRTAPHRWCWSGISRTSMNEQLERRLEQVEEMHQRAK